MMLYTKEEWQVDQDDDNAWAEILPDTDLRVGQPLYKAKKMK